MQLWVATVPHMGIEQQQVLGGEDSFKYIVDCITEGTIESVLMGNITAWYGNSIDQDHKALQRVVCLAERIIGGTLPCLKDLRQAV